ncbi:hypothetical protein SB861_47260 [Paraburkholderia sp. SIMBA_049]
MDISAARACQDQISGNAEDGRLGLKYVLLRLETVGVTERDRAILRQLTVQACGNQDVSETVRRIQDDKSSSALALAIAEIVAAATESPEAACLGALFGAHGAVFTAFMSEQQSTPLALAINGAITGASTATSIALLETKSLGMDLNNFLIAD